MEVLESALLAEFIGYIKLVSKVRAVVDAAEGGAGTAVRDESFSTLPAPETLDAAAVASSARRFLAGIKAFEELLERLAGPGGDLVRVLNRAAATGDDMDVDGDAAAATEDDMDVDGKPAPGARHGQEGSGRRCASAGSAAALLLPSPGAKRKRACGGEVDTARPQKRRRHAWTRSHHWPPSGSGRVSYAQRARRRPAAAALPRSHSRRARSVALAISRIRRRNGKPPPPTRNRPQPGPGLGQHFSRITL